MFKRTIIQISVHIWDDNKTASIASSLWLLNVNTNEFVKIETRRHVSQFFALRYIAEHHMLIEKTDFDTMVSAHKIICGR